MSANKAKNVLVIDSLKDFLNGNAVKRIFDFTLAFILFIVFLPLFIIILIFIKTSSGGPIIYRQKRIGKNNRPFILYKFRTMKQSETGSLWTDENDERITLESKMLRDTHLDELPQLINILKGDISFVGPRPERLELVQLYKQLPHYELRHTIKPGLTGWAQLNYKASSSLEEAGEKLKYDIYYINNRSFILDLIILLKTIKHLYIPILQHKDDDSRGVKIRSDDDDK